jgi:hypothetical protein
MERQMEVEHQMLTHLMEGLRIALGWQVQGGDASRKLSTLRFVAGSFQRHLEHVLTLEECDGYLERVLESAPHLGRAVDTLRAEHDRFRAETRRILQRLEHLPSNDLAGLEQTGGELRALLGQVEEHNRKETKLLHEALARDRGGEG